MLSRHPLLKAVFIFIGSWIIYLTVLVIIYFAWIREWQMNWGATNQEVSRYMAGDELLENPEFNATRAVHIKGSPEQVWPWLVQMGYKRAGFYAFDKLDNAGLPSAEHIMPEYQDLKIGDLIPLGGPSFVKVMEMEPNQSMLWVFQKGTGPWQNSTWSWVLCKIDGDHTRLVSRLRLNYTFNSLQNILMLSLLDATEICMMRTCLLGIKRRVEESQAP